jgi:hypothetical protein
VLKTIPPQSAEAARNNDRMVNSEHGWSASTVLSSREFPSVHAELASGRAIPDYSVNKTTGQHEASSDDLSLRHSTFTMLTG